MTRQRDILGRRGLSARGVCCAASSPAPAYQGEGPEGCRSKPPRTDWPMDVIGVDANGFPIERWPWVPCIPGRRIWVVERQRELVELRSTPSKESS